MPSETPIPALLTKALILRHFVPAGLRTLNRWISSGDFPPADISFGAKVRFWKRETVEGWIEERAEGGTR